MSGEPPVSVITGLAVLHTTSKEKKSDSAAASGLMPMQTAPAPLPPTRIPLLPPTKQCTSCIAFLEKSSFSASQWSKSAAAAATQRRCIPCSAKEEEEAALAKAASAKQRSAASSADAGQTVDDDAGDSAGRSETAAAAKAKKKRHSAKKKDEQQRDKAGDGLEAEEDTDVVLDNYNAAVAELKALGDGVAADSHSEDDLETRLRNEDPLVVAAWNKFSELKKKLLGKRRILFEAQLSVTLTTAKEQQEAGRFYEATILVWDNIKNEYQFILQDLRVGKKTEKDRSPEKLNPEQSPLFTPLLQELTQCFCFSFLSFMTSDMDDIDDATFRARHETLIKSVVDDETRNGEDPVINALMWYQSLATEGEEDRLRSWLMYLALLKIPQTAQGCSELARKFLIDHRNATNASLALGQTDSSSSNLKQLHLMYRQFARSTRGISAQRILGEAELVLTRLAGDWKLSDLTRDVVVRFATELQEKSPQACFDKLQNIVTWLESRLDKTGGARTDDAFFELFDVAVTAGCAAAECMGAETALEFFGKLDAHWPSVVQMINSKQPRLTETRKQAFVNLAVEWKRGVVVVVKNQRKNRASYVGPEVEEKACKEYLAVCREYCEPWSIETQSATISLGNHYFGECKEEKDKHKLCEIYERVDDVLQKACDLLETALEERVGDYSEKQRLSMLDSLKWRSWDKAVKTSEWAHNFSNMERWESE